MAARIGDRGQALCSLYPSGRVSIANAPIAARAEAGPIEAGTEIVVVGGDRFSLMVRPFDASMPLESIKGFGDPVLNAKEEAARQAELAAEHRLHQHVEYQRDCWKFTCRAGCAGFLVGIGMVGWEWYRAGYSPDLICLPLLSVACFTLLILLTFLMGTATENLSFFFSIPAAVLALMAGIILRGPFFALGLCFGVGFFVNLASLVIEAMRHPIRE